MITIDFSLGVSVGAIVGFAITRIIDHRLAETRNIKTIQLTESVKAVASFKAAFAPTLAALELGWKAGNKEIFTIDVQKALSDALLRQATEIELFRPYIPESKAMAYYIAWNKYLNEVANYGFLATEFRTDIDNPHHHFKKHIHDILQFAEIKDK